ncbi:ABC transporter substrate-binding protein [Trichothermofontia sichuanensis B231]|uniref:ABC transporter substrate-binding protein n=1 Tax=Trichothermofontia sichuanensis TaxID=3045816 RepID=UPI00224614EE|nr:ABC transporter substrate-binding protein [Trichothermofontia sichuanensis]UZQ52805.1 ABC transporter substrate-binding protein [Trichothermofontia sichuanensis B231]
MARLLNRRQLLQYGSLVLSSNLLWACNRTGPPASPSTGAPTRTSSSSALEKVTFGTNWYAQAEHGGFYQAVATGIYADYGLEVTIRMGGPQVNGTQLLMGKAVDFFMNNSTDAILAIQEGIPKVTVAAIFQKSPQVLIAHPNTGVNTLADLKGRPIFVSKGAAVSYWPFLRQKFGFTNDQQRPYNFNVAPFLADKQSAQQGYLTSEPLTVEQEGGFKPVVFLLADYGYTPYDTTIETRREVMEKTPDLVQRFVDASIKGWYSYLEGDPTPANQLIKQENPQMTDELLAYGIAKMKEYGIVVSGEATTQGIGAMVNDRWRELFEMMQAQGVFKPDTPYQDAYTLQFVNKGVEFYRQ